MVAIDAPRVMPAPDGWVPRLNPYFRDFLADLWKFLGLPPPTEVQIQIADYLQSQIVNPDGSRGMVKAYRGCGKSWITDAFAVWALDLNPNHKIEIVSAGEDLAKNNATFIRRIIKEFPVCAHLRTRRGQNDKVHEFDVGPASTSKDPSVKTAGITGQITGTRATILIADDIEVPKNSLTHKMRLKLKELTGEFDSILVARGHILYLGTPQSIESIYNDLPEKGYNVRCWPARIPARIDSYNAKDHTGAIKNQLGRIVHQMIAQGLPAGSPIDPKRFDKAELDKKELSMGRSAFQLQFMLDTSLSDLDRYPLKLRDIICADVDPDKAPAQINWMPDPKRIWEHIPCVGLKDDAWYRPASISELFVPYEFTVMSIDPSGSGKDETAYAVIKVCRGKLYLVASGGLQGGYSDEVMTQLAVIAKKWNATNIVIENNFGQGMFRTLLAPHVLKVTNCVLEERTVHTQKEARIIDTLEPVLNQHRLVVAADVAMQDYHEAEKEKQSKSLFFQLTRLTRERGSLPFDDRLDALEAAVWKAMGLLGVDTEKQDEIAKEEAEQKRANDFVERHRKAGTLQQLVASINAKNGTPTEVRNPLRHY